MKLLACLSGTNSTVQTSMVTGVSIILTFRTYRAIEFTGSSQLRNDTHANQVFPYNTTITVLAVVKTALIDQRALWALSDNLSSTFGIYGKFGAFAVGGDGLAFGRFHDANHFIEIKNANQPTLEYQDRLACFTYYWNATGTDASESLTMYQIGRAHV